MTPLFGRWLRSIGNGELADAEVEQAELQRMLELFDEQLPELNGRAWRSVIAPALPVIADASDHEFGGYALYTGWECCISFNAAELQVLATLPAALSSTMLEIRGARKTLRELLRTAPHLLAGGHVQIWGDNSAAISNCELMRSNLRVWPEVRELHLLAMRHQLLLMFGWRPRTHALLQHADTLSKVQDASDWRLSRAFVRMQLFQQTELGLPDVDMFASDWASQVPMYVSVPTASAWRSTRGRRIGRLGWETRQWNAPRASRWCFCFPRSASSPWCGPN